MCFLAGGIETGSKGELFDGIMLRLELIRGLSV
jgi:hypothetical protein